MIIVRKVWILLVVIYCCRAEVAILCMGEVAICWRATALSVWHGCDVDVVGSDDGTLVKV